MNGKSCPVTVSLFQGPDGSSCAEEEEEEEEEEKEVNLFKVIAESGQREQTLTFSTSEPAVAFPSRPTPSNAFSPPDAVTSEANQFSG